MEGAAAQHARPRDGTAVQPHSDRQVTCSDKRLHKDREGYEEDDQRGGDQHGGDGRERCSVTVDARTATLNTTA